MRQTVRPFQGLQLMPYRHLSIHLCIDPVSLRLESLLTPEVDSCIELVRLDVSLYQQFLAQGCCQG